MHLPFNTLPQNKKWIMGCQCKECLSEILLTNEEKEFFYHIHSIYWDVYNLDFNENWTLTENYNPLYNSKYDTGIVKKINGLHLNFL